MLRSLVQLSGRGLRAHRAAHTALCIRTMSDAHKGKEYMDFPGGKVPFTEDMQWQGPGYSSAATIPCYRAIGPQGEPLPDASVPHTLDKDTALKMYKTMVDLQAVDTIFYEAQRQVRGACVCVCFFGGGFGGLVLLPLAHRDDEGWDTTPPLGVPASHHTRGHAFASLAKDGGLPDLPRS